MIHCAKYPVKNGKKVQDFLKKENLFHEVYKTVKKNSDLYSPLQSPHTSPLFELCEKPESFFPEKYSSQTLKSHVESILTPNEQKVFKRAFDVIGTIAILEIEPEIRPKEKEIGDIILKTHPSIKSVFRKDGSHQGDFRIQPLVHVAGENTTITTHKENSVMIELDVSKVYFSPRLSNERLRIAKQVTPREHILHMFSGCAPFECVIGKLAQPLAQIGIELNPDGHTYGLKNIKKNKLSNITLHCGDAKDIVEQMSQTFDRIVLNLPKSAYQFLPQALSVSKKGTILHYYDFLHEDDFERAKTRVKDACDETEFTPKFLGIHTCGTQGVKTYRICVDILLQ
ncbi:MAG: class I SAM-dependent methyltransferase [Candidatus Woesearchaeota archaeon]